MSGSHPPHLFWGPHLQKPTSYEYPRYISLLHRRSPRFTTAILITGLGIFAALIVFTSLILDTIVRGRREVRRLAYPAGRAPSRTPCDA